MFLKLVANEPYPQFEVYDEDRLVVRIKIDKEMQALRLTYKDTRRVFFIDEEKLRKNSVYNLVNEYDQPLGFLVKDKISGNSGEVEVEGIKLNYRLSSSPLKEIILSENNSLYPILHCRLSDALLLDYSNYINYFIFALAFFTFLANEKKEVAYFAEA